METAFSTFAHPDDIKARHIVMPQGLKMKLGGAGEQTKGRAGAFQVEFRKDPVFFEHVYTSHDEDEKNLLHSGSRSSTGSLWVPSHATLSLFEVFPAPAFNFVPDNLVMRCWAIGKAQLEG